MERPEPNISGASFPFEMDGRISSCEHLDDQCDTTRIDAMGFEGSNEVEDGGGGGWGDCPSKNREEDVQKFLDEGVVLVLGGAVVGTRVQKGDTNALYTGPQSPFRLSPDLEGPGKCLRPCRLVQAPSVKFGARDRGGDDADNLLWCYWFELSLNSSDLDYWGDLKYWAKGRSGSRYVRSVGAYLRFVLGRELMSPGDARFVHFPKCDANGRGSGERTGCAEPSECSAPQGMCEGAGGGAGELPKERWGNGYLRIGRITTMDFNNSRSLLFGLIRGKPSTNANLEFGLQDLLSRSVSLGILCTQGSSSNGSPRFTIWWKVSMVWGGSEGGCSVATLVVGLPELLPVRRRWKLLLNLPVCVLGSWGNHMAATSVPAHGRSSCRCFLCLTYLDLAMYVQDRSSDERIRSNKRCTVDESFIQRTSSFLLRELEIN
ncbi:hypothetical protein M513_13318 [Trichuris suis]|uniref:Uncharacterized protein n=1 Tax=Trichuris suis TaxID=68888 RepID=A0A085LLG0_9BILA|nr:hypothetical protein M513_13318 [Trichuris suis]